MKRVPNILSGLRLVAAPALLILAWIGQSDAFLCLFAAALSTDVADGWLARRFGLQSELGARLDSLGDLLMWSTLPFAGWWLWPERVIDQLPFVVVAISSLLMPIAIGLARWKRLTAYHTWGAKLSSLLIGPGLLVLFATSSDVLFQVATGVLALSAVDEIAITFVLRSWRVDVPSVVHALQEP